jgi:hypothetical protein
MSRPIARLTAVAFALIAVSLLLFQPICEAAELREPHPASHATAPSGGAGDSCCLIQVAAPLPAATAATERPTALLQPTLGSPAVRPEMLFSGAVASTAPLPVSRYYARSARIQR